MPSFHFLSLFSGIFGLLGNAFIPLIEFFSKTLSSRKSLS